MTQSNTNIWAWHDSLGKQDFRKSWANGVKWPISCHYDVLLPFQVVRTPSTGDAITEFKLVNNLTGAETDIKNNMIAGGLEVVSFTDYDLIIYPAIINLGMEQPIGEYYARMSDGTNTWYSEVITLCSDVSGLLKIEYYHGEDFSYPNGHIRYTFPYKTYCYLHTQIALPEYKYSEKVVERDGYVFPLQQTSWKEHNFKVLGTEPLFDALRFARLHDFLEINHNGYTYSVDEMRLEVEWTQQANIGVGSFEIKTDTVVVVNAKGLTDLTYEATEGSCMAVTYTAVAHIDYPSDDWTNGEYTPTAGGSAVSFAEGDLVLATVSGQIRMYRREGTSYAPANPLSLHAIYNTDSKEYYYADDYGIIRQPYVMSVGWDGTNARVYADSFPAGITTVVAVDSLGAETEVAFGGRDKLRAGVSFTHSDLASVKLKVASAACGSFHTSSTTAPGGIGVMVIGTDFDVT